VFSVQAPSPRARGAAALGVALALLAASPARPEPPPKRLTDKQVSAFADGLLRRLNEERVKAGVPVLKKSAALTDAAQAHARAAAAKGTFQVTPETPFGRLGEKDRLLVRPGLFTGRSTVSVEAWVKDCLGKKELRAFVLDPEVNLLAVGAADNVAGRVYALIALGTALADVSTAEGRAALADEIVALTNAERRKAGLKPLKANAALAKAAQGYAENMARQKKMDHYLDGTKPSERMRAAGYKGGFTGENLANGPATAAGVLKMWMNSPAHRKNILSPTYTEIGVGVAASKEGNFYFCQCFGKPN
jgi:uncharacterized protein YkwD